MENMEVKVKNKELIEKKDIGYIHLKAKDVFEKLSGRSVLLTGAGGFLGYYLIKAILDWNDKNKNKIFLTALSNFRSGIPLWMTASKNRADFKIIRGDIVNYVLPSNVAFDHIIHAASIASPTFYRLYPIDTINSNVQGLYLILNYMIKRNKTTRPVKGLLFFSSSEVYGDPTEGNIPTPETYRGNVSFTGPRACYDESKRFCETLCVNYSKVYNLSIMIARPFNNYGPGMKMTDGRVIADFSRNILQNKDIIMFSNGNPSRTFCYVVDGLVGYLKILARGRNSEAYNIGTEKPEISMKDLALKMARIGRQEFGYKGKVITKLNKDKNYLTDNPQRRCPKIQKARRELGYNPEITLEEGLRRVMIWYRETKL